MISPFPSRFLPDTNNRRRLCGDDPYRAGAKPSTKSAYVRYRLYRLTDLKQKIRLNRILRLCGLPMPKIPPARSLWPNDYSVAFRRYGVCRMSLGEVFLLDTPSAGKDNVRCKVLERRGPALFAGPEPVGFGRDLRHLGPGVRRVGPIVPPTDENHVEYARTSTTRFGGRHAGDSYGDRYLFGGENSCRGRTKGTVGQRIADKIPGNAFPGC